MIRLVFRGKEFKVMCLLVLLLSLTVQVHAASVSVENLMATQNAWEITAKKFASRFKRVDGKHIWYLRATNKHPITTVYKQPVQAWGQLHWTMRQPDADEKSGMLIWQLHGMTDLAGKPIVARIIPGQQTVQLGDQTQKWQTVFEDLGAEMQWILGWNDASKELELKLGDETLIRQKAQWQDPNLKLQMDVTRGPLAITQMRWISPRDVTLSDEQMTDITLRTAGLDWFDLPSSWTAYCGIHYSTQDSEHRWSIVRGYGAPHIAPVKPQDMREDATLRTGPFSERTIRLDLQDIGRKVRKRSIDFTTLLPKLKADELDAIYQAPIRFIDKNQLVMNKDIAYWTIRLACEWNPDYATDHIFWQWGNEINGLHLDLFGNKADVKQGKNRWSFSNQPEKADAYAEHILAPGIEVIRKVGQDVYGDPNRLKVVCGSLGNSYNSKARAWLDRVLQHRIAGDHAPTLKGQRVLDLVDILCVHYPVASDPFDKTLSGYFADYMKPGHVQGIWVTEEHGRRGRGTASILMRGMRFMQWAGRYQLNAQQTRICWWGTTNPKPGGTASIAIDQLGQLLGNTPLTMGVMSLPNQLGKAYLLRPQQANSTMQLFLVIEPTRDHVLNVGKLKLPDLTHGSHGNLDAKWIVYSTDHPPVERSLTDKITTNDGNQGWTIDINEAINGFAIVSVVSQ